jgi:hypothetical protein
MATTRIDSLAARITEREQQTSPVPKHPNRYTAPAVQLKKRLDILWARLRVSSTTPSSYHSPWYVDPTDAWTLIVEWYDKMMTDIYQHLSYLHALDRYTKNHTHNRGYYCRKKQQIYIYLSTTYYPILYTMWWVAWDWFFRDPNIRQPLHTTLFNYLMQLQDDKER